MNAKRRKIWYNIKWTQRFSKNGIVRWIRDSSHNQYHGWKSRPLASESKITSTQARHAGLESEFYLEIMHANLRTHCPLQMVPELWKLWHDWIKCAFAENIILWIQIIYLLRFWTFSSSQPTKPQRYSIISSRNDEDVAHFQHCSFWAWWVNSFFFLNQISNYISLFWWIQCLKINPAQNYYSCFGCISKFELMSFRKRHEKKNFRHKESKKCVLPNAKYTMP